MLLFWGWVRLGVGATISPKVDFSHTIGLQQFSWTLWRKVGFSRTLWHEVSSLVPFGVKRAYPTSFGRK